MSVSYILISGTVLLFDSFINHMFHTVQQDHLQGHATGLAVAQGFSLRMAVMLHYYHLETFLCFSEQGCSQFNFVLGPANHMEGPGLEPCVSIRFQHVVYVLNTYFVKECFSDKRWSPLSVYKMPNT